MKRIIVLTLKTALFRHIEELTLFIHDTSQDFRIIVGRHQHVYFIPCILKLKFIKTNPGSR